jgi:hypothetical protein
LRHLKSKLDITTTNVLDLAKALRENRHQDMGAKAAVAKFLACSYRNQKRPRHQLGAAAVDGQADCLRGE